MSASREIAAAAIGCPASQDGQSGTENSNGEACAFTVARPAGSFSAGAITLDGIEYLTPVRLTHCAFRFWGIGQWCRWPVLGGRDFCGKHGWYA